MTQRPSESMQERMARVRSFRANGKPATPEEPIHKPVAPEESSHYGCRVAIATLQKENERLSARLKECDHILTQIHAIGYDRVMAEARIERERTQQTLESIRGGADPIEKGMGVSDLNFTEGIPPVNKDEDF